MKKIEVSIELEFGSDCMGCDYYDYADDTFKVSDEAYEALCQVNEADAFSQSQPLADFENAAKAAGLKFSAEVCDEIALLHKNIIELAREQDACYWTEVAIRRGDSNYEIEEELEKDLASGKFHPEQTEEEFLAGCDEEYDDEDEAHHDYIESIFDDYCWWLKNNNDPFVMAEFVGVDLESFDPEAVSYSFALLEGGEDEGSGNDEEN